MAQSYRGISETYDLSAAPLKFVTNTAAYLCTPTCIFIPVDAPLRNCHAPVTPGDRHRMSPKPETSSLPHLLMCPPTLYEVNYVINPWMAGNLGAASQSRAIAQWSALHAVLSNLTTVHLIDPVPGSPDMVFTANAGLARNGTVALSSFFHPERQAEEQHFRRWFAAAGYRILDLPRATPFEGEGDALFSPGDSPGSLRLWVGFGTRTVQSSHTALHALWSLDESIPTQTHSIHSLHLIDPRFYHLDTCFAPLDDGSLLYFPEAFDAPSRALIESVYTPAQRIAVDEADATCFASNAVNLGRTVVLNHISLALRHRLEARGFTVIELALDEFLKAGGAAKCLVMKLSPAPTIPTLSSVLPIAAQQSGGTRFSIPAPEPTLPEAGLQ